MALFKKKCEYCRTKIESDAIRRNVKVPGYIGTFEKPFCSKEHADMYEQEMMERSKNSTIRGCC